MAHHGRLVAEGKLQAADAGIAARETILRAVRIMVQHFQLDIAQLASFEVLLR